MKSNHVFWLAIFVLAIIIVVPWLFTQTYFSFGDYSGTGAIGDTIGGLTSPFINGLAAILVFVTFREQVKANKILEEQNKGLRTQQEFSRIENQISMIYQFHIYNGQTFSFVVGAIMEYKDEFIASDINPDLINKLDMALLLHQEVDQLQEQLVKFKGPEEDSKFLKHRFIMMYDLKYGSDAERLVDFVKGEDEVNPRYRGYIEQLKSYHASITAYVNANE